MQCASQTEGWQGVLWKFILGNQGTCWGDCLYDKAKGDGGQGQNTIKSIEEGQWAHLLGLINVGVGLWRPGLAVITSGSTPLSSSLYASFASATSATSTQSHIQNRPSVSTSDCHHMQQQEQRTGWMWTTDVNHFTGSRTERENTQTHWQNTRRVNTRRNQRLDPVTHMGSR